MLHQQQRQTLVAVMTPMKENKTALKFQALGLDVDEQRQPVVVAMMVVDKKKEPTLALVAPATSPTTSSSHWC